MQSPRRSHECVHLTIRNRVGVQHSHTSLPKPEIRRVRSVTLTETNNGCGVLGTRTSENQVPHVRWLPSSNWQSEFNHSTNRRTNKRRRQAPAPVRACALKAAFNSAKGLICPLETLASDFKILSSKNAEIPHGFGREVPSKNWKRYWRGQMTLLFENLNWDFPPSPKLSPISRHVSDIRYTPFDVFPSHIPLHAYNWAACFC